MLSCFGSDPGPFAALVGQIMGKHPACLMENILRKPVVTMRGMLFMLLFQ